jgi:hypothetical protein
MNGECSLTLCMVSSFNWVLLKFIWELSSSVSIVSDYGLDSRAFGI